MGFKKRYLNNHCDKNILTTVIVYTCHVPLMYGCMTYDDNCTDDKKCFNNIRIFKITFFNKVTPYFIQLLITTINIIIYC